MTNTNKLTAETTATITVGTGRPSRYLEDVAGAEDYDVTVVVGDRTIEGEITLSPDEANNGRMTSHGGSLDTWCSGTLLSWIYTLTDRTRREVVGSLAGGAGTEDVEIETEAGVRRAEFVELVRECGSDPIAEENAILSIGREFLPACALAVLDGGEPTIEYWDFVIGQTTQAQAERDREIAAGHEWHK